MEPTIEKFLQGIPFAGMGTTLERNGLIGVVREMIKANKYTVEYILNYCESVGYQRKMAEEVFEELTGLSPKLIINNNEYYNAPIYVPACTIAWGMAKSKKDVAFYVVPGSYGYSVMEKNETEAPVEVTQTATIPEAIDELKKVAKNIQTLDKIITSKLLETEDIQSSANDIDQTAKPYFSDPIRELKKNFKNKVIDINTFEREARKLVAEQKISVEDGEHLMNWEQDLLDNSENPEEYNKVLQKDEEWNQLQGTETEGDFEDAYHQLFNMLEELDILSQFAADTGRNEKEAYIELAKDIGQEFGVDYKSLLGEMELRNPEVVKKIEELSLKSNEKEIKTWINSSKKVKSWTSDEEDEYLNSDEYLDSYEYLYSQLVNGNITEYKNGVKKLYEQGPSKLMEYMDWLEEHNINPKEALKVMKNASLKKVKSNNGSFEKQQDFPLVYIEENDEEIYPKEQFVDEWNEDHPEEPIGEWDEQDDAYFDWLDQHYNLLEDEMQDYLSKINLPKGVKITIKYGKDNGAQLWVEGNTTNKNEIVKILTDAANTCGWKIEASLKKATNIPTGNVPTEKITLADGRTFTVRYNPKEKGITTIFNEDDKEIGVDAATRLQLLRKLFHKGEPTIVNKSASKNKSSRYDGFTYYVDENGVMKIFTPDNRLVSEISDCKNCDKSTLENIFHETLDNSSFGNKKSSKKVTSSKIIQVNVYDIDWNFDELDEEDKPTEKLPDFYNNLNIEIDEDAEDFEMTEDDIEQMIYDNISIELFNEFGFYPESYNWTYSNKKQSSKKVTAENMTLDDIEEDKTEVEEQMEKINDTPAKELMEDTTPLDYFDKETQDDKVDTINDVVSKCITEFSDKFKEFTKYDVSILSYKTKILAPYTPNQEEMIEDKEINADAILQVILTVNNKADETTTKKLLAVFSITDGKMQWNGTVRDEDDKVVAFSEQGLDSIFNDEEVEETDIKEVI